jgi:predicted nucleic acid-binding protein
VYLLDTNVLRAFDGKAQNQCVNKWFREELNENDIHFCASVIMEQRKGIEKKRKTHPKEAEEIENYNYVRGSNIAN